MTRLDEYKLKIKVATTKEALRDLAYDAFKEDFDCSIWDMAKGKKSLYTQVVALCVERELELDGYNKQEIRRMKKDARR